MLRSTRSASTRLCVLAATLVALVACASGGGAPGAKRTKGGEAAPISFMQSDDSTQMFRTFDVRADLSKDSLWSIVTGALDRRYKLATQDKASGSAQSGWRPLVDADGIPDLRYKSRVSIKFVGTDWRRLQVKSEATWQPTADPALVGYDRDLLIEAMADLRARVGRG